MSNIEAWQIPDEKSSKAFLVVDFPKNGATASLGSVSFLRHVVVVVFMTGFVLHDTWFKSQGPTKPLQQRKLGRSMTNSTSFRRGNRSGILSSLGIIDISSRLSSGTRSSAGSSCSWVNQARDTLCK